MHAQAPISSLHLVLADVPQIHSASVQSHSMRRCGHIRRPFQHFSTQSLRPCLVVQSSKQDRAQQSTAASFSGRPADIDLAGGGSSIPQPQASNAGSASPPTPSSNGSRPPAQQHGSQPETQQSRTNELSQLRSDVSKLSELVTTQARMLQGQMHDLEQARSLIDMHAMTNTLSMSAPTQTIKAGWNKDVKPFEVQRTAIGDRRYLGGYDARFHSTNM